MHNCKWYWLEEIINRENLYWSIDQCYLGTSWKDSASNFFQYAEYNVEKIMDTFYNPENPFGYQLDKIFHTVVDERGTHRLISSNTFGDRVVLKTFNQFFLLPAFVPTMIPENGASLPGRGVDYSLKILHTNILNALREYGSDFYFLKLDIRKYFDSISHIQMLDLIQNHTRDQRIIRFFNNILLQFQFDPLINAFRPLEPQGIGLGSEVDQTFGLLALNKVDHKIKEYYHIKYYIRYMDDMILIHKDPKYLNQILNEIQKDLQEIKLEIHNKKSYIAHISKGIPFLKVNFKLNNDYKIERMVNKDNVRRIRSKLLKMRKLYENGCIDISSIENYYHSASSALLKSDSKNLIETLDEEMYLLFGIILDKPDRIETIRRANMRKYN